MIITARKEKTGVRSLFLIRLKSATTSKQKKRPDPFVAFTLLEIVLALAILAGSLAALGEVMRLADQNAEAVRDETQAQMLAESVMAEILSGARPLATVNRAVFPLDTEPRWEYSIAVAPSERNELLVLQVSVAEELPPEMQPARFDLVRWVLNPDYLPDVAQSATSPESDSGASSGSAESAGSSSAFGESSAGDFTGGQQP